MKRRAPVVLVAVGLVALLGSYVWYAQLVAGELRRETTATSQLYARVYEGISDTTAGAAEGALSDLVLAIKEMGVPVILTDTAGRPTDVANLPFTAADVRAALYLSELDAQHRPLVLADGRHLHFGDTPFLRRMRFVPLAQAVLLAILLGAAVAVFRSRNRADRERVWAGMARESAHQLGTPLSSLHGWLELLREREGDPMVAQAVPHMRSDIERLERVAHRFERIGRPPRRDAVNVTEIAAAVVSYFAARVPSLADSIQIRIDHAEGTLSIPGDRVLLEWAIESLVKNAIDALAGRGGNITVGVGRGAGGDVRVRVEDDGPGVPRDLRRKIFSAGFTTKERGWGIGLALTRRIVEENHGGRLILLPTEAGAAFEITLRG